MPGAVILKLKCLRRRKECGEIQEERDVDRERNTRRKCDRAIDMEQCSLTESTEKVPSIYSFFTLAPEIE